MTIKIHQWLPACRAAGRGGAVTEKLLGGALAPPDGFIACWRRLAAARVAALRAPVARQPAARKSSPRLPLHHDELPAASWQQRNST